MYKNTDSAAHCLVNGLMIFSRPGRIEGGEVCLYDSFAVMRLRSIARPVLRYHHSREENRLLIDRDI